MFGVCLFMRLFRLFKFYKRNLEEALGAETLFKDPLKKFIGFEGFSFSFFANLIFKDAFLNFW